MELHENIFELYKTFKDNLETLPKAEKKVTHLIYSKFNISLKNTLNLPFEYELRKIRNGKLKRNKVYVIKYDYNIAIVLPDEVKSYMRCKIYEINTEERVSFIIRSDKTDVIMHNGILYNYVDKNEKVFYNSRWHIEIAEYMSCEIISYNI